MSLREIIRKNKRMFVLGVVAGVAIAGFGIYATTAHHADAEFSTPIGGNAGGQTGNASTSPIYVYVANASGTPVQVSLATLIAGENQAANVMDVESAYNYSTPAATANSTTTVKSSAGYVQICNVTPLAGATTTVVKLYDGTTAGGTLMQSWQFQEPATQLVPVPVPVYELFSNGLTIQQTGATSTVSCSYR